jgi:hypothetical protein
MMVRPKFVYVAQYTLITNMTTNKVFTIGKLWLQWVLANGLGWFICLGLIFVAAFSQFEDNSDLMMTVDPTPFYDRPILHILSVAAVAAFM